MSEAGEASGPPWRSVSLRLAFFYGVLVTIIMMVTVSIIYLRTVTVFYRNMERQVAISMGELKARFEAEGGRSLAHEIDQQLLYNASEASDLFLLLGPDGSKLAGNLDQAPQDPVHLDSSGRTLVVRDGKPAIVYLRLSELSDRSRLYVGNDLQDQESLESLVASSIAVASGFALLLLGVGLFVFRAELGQSLEPLRGTLARVAAGDVGVRVPASRDRDEFAMLGGDINRMLDRIEALMGGVRHVSDTIAHNLRTPLTRILLGLRDWADGESLSPERRGRLELTLREIEDLIAVFEKLLHIAESEAGGARAQFGPVVVAGVVREVLDYYEVLADAAGARLLFDPGCDPDASILGDADLIAQALANLVDNALKYGGAGCQVSVSIRAGADLVTVAVSDDGPGVPAQRIGQLGDRFFRLDPQVQGHGLGLAAVTAIVATHGGRLHFENMQPGLSVRMELPRHLS